MLCYITFILIIVSSVRCKGISVRWQKHNVTDTTYGNCTAMQEPISHFMQCIVECSITGCKSVNVNEGNETILCELCSEYPFKANLTVTSRPGWTVYYRKVTKELRAFCMMDFQGGGWTVIQSRVSNKSFYRTWQEYRDGFGDDFNFWLGLENIPLLIAQGTYEILMYMETETNVTAIAKYANFSIGDESTKYKLSVGSYSYDANYVDPGDKFSKDTGMMFTTKDRDNDKWSPGNCAQSHSSAWWYTACYATDLNLPFGKMFWENFSNKNVLSRMMIRPK